MRVILDCNVVVSAGMTDGFVRRVVRHVLGEHDLIASERILAEYRRVAGYPKFTSDAASHIAALISRIKARAQFADDVPCSVSLPDHSDTIYVAVALEAGADALVTGNLKHFPEQTYGTTRVLSVRGFADLAGIAP